MELGCRDLEGRDLEDRDLEDRDLGDRDLEDRDLDSTLNSLKSYQGLGDWQRLGAEP